MPRGHLIDLATDLIKLVGSLTPIPPVDDEGLRRRFVDLLTEFHARAVRGGYADDLVDAARFALVSFIDEQVLGLDAPIANAWARNPMRQVVLPPSAHSGSFRERLDSLRPPGSPERADVLEVFHLCLCLGSTAGLEAGDRQRLITELGQEIRAVRSGATTPLSPAWEPRGGNVPTPPLDRWHGIPLWAIPAALGVILVVWWIAAGVWTTSAIDHLVRDFPVR